VKEVTEVEALLDPVEIDQIEILVAIEDPLDLEESEEKEDKTKFYSHKKTIKNDGFFMYNNYFFKIMLPSSKLQFFYTFHFLINL